MNRPSALTVLRIALRVVAALLAVLVAVRLCAANAQTFDPTGVPPDWLFRQMLWGEVWLAPHFLVPFLLWAVADFGRVRGLLLRRPPCRLGFWRFVWACALASAVAYLLVEALVPRGEDQASIAFMEALRPWQLVAYGPIVAVAGPLMEELLFRGVLLHAGPAWLALPASSLLFGFAHGPNAFALPLSLLGLALGLMALRTKSLLPSIGFHMLFNFLSFLFMLTEL